MGYVYDIYIESFDFLFNYKKYIYFFINTGIFKFLKNDIFKDIKSKIK